MLESSGFVSIIPRRASAERLNYSEYIGHELALARRSKLPRLFFVDRLILERFREDFPADAIPFEYDEPSSFAKLHDSRIRLFEETLLPRPNSALLGNQDRKKATVIAPNNNRLLQAADGVASILGSSGYQVQHLTGNKLSRALDDVRFLESLWDSDICVFILGDRLSYANVVMGMAYAHCIPSLRLKFDEKSTETHPDVTGLIKWKSIDELIDVFSAQFSSFSSGMQEPVSMAKSSSSADAILKLSIGQWDWKQENVWDPNDGNAIVNHLSIDESFVRDRVDRVQAELNVGLGANPTRKKSMLICRTLYDGIKSRDDFVYDLEPQSMISSKQPIRTARDLDANNSATCIDLACLFASLLESSYQRSVIVVIEGSNIAHALVGYWAPDEPKHSSLSIDMGSIRGAVRRGDLVLFEATGVAQSERSVGGETDQERKLGNGRLDFTTSKKSASALLDRSEISLRYLVDVNSLRSAVKKML